MNPEKRNQLIFLALITCLVTVILYLTVITGMEGALLRVKGNLQAADRELRLARAAAAGEADTQRALERQQAALRALEAKAPSGERYTWLSEAFEAIRKRAGVDPVSVDTPVRIERTTEDSGFVVLPGKEYIALRGALSVQGTFFQLGSFLADLENELPFLQVEGVQLPSSQAAATVGSGSNRLVMRVEYAVVAPR